MPEYFVVLGGAYIVDKRPFQNPRTALVVVPPDLAQKTPGLLFCLHSNTAWQREQGLGLTIVLPRSVLQSPAAVLYLAFHVNNAEGSYPPLGPQPPSDLITIALVGRDSHQADPNIEVQASELCVADLDTSYGSLRLPDTTGAFARRHRQDATFELIPSKYELNRDQPPQCWLLSLSMRRPGRRLRPR